MWIGIVAAGILAVVAVVELRSWRKPDRPGDLQSRVRRRRGIDEGRAGMYDR